MILRDQVPSRGPQTAALVRVIGHDRAAAFARALGSEERTLRRAAMVPSDIDRMKLWIRPGCSAAASAVVDA